MNDNTRILVTTKSAERALDAFPGACGVAPDTLVRAPALGYTWAPPEAYDGKTLLQWHEYIEGVAWTELEVLLGGNRLPSAEAVCEALAKATGACVYLPGDGASAIEFDPAGRRLPVELAYPDEYGITGPRLLRVEGQRLIPHHDIHASVLRRDPRDGVVAIYDRTQVGDALSKGFYVDVGPRLAGIHPSPNGPIFFHDEHSYVLGADATAEVVNGTGDDNTFVLSTGGRERLRIRYEPPPTGFDAWSQDESMTDLFRWIAENFPSERFNASYTE